MGFQIRLPVSSHTIRKYYAAFLALGLSIWGGAPFDFLSEAQEKTAGQTEAGCLRTLKEDDLSDKLGGQSFIDLDVGEEVSLRIIAGRTSRKLAGPPSGWMKISVLERGNRVRDLPESFYLDYKLLVSGPYLYWMIGEYTGGAYCCVRYHFFGRAPNGFLQYLGVTLGSVGSLDDEPFLCRSEGIYLRGQDTRFMNFHTPQAATRLIFDIYYRLTPASIIVDDRPFRREFLRELEKVEFEIQELLENRQSIPASIFLERKEFGFFSDDLGELLVKKAVLNLNAGEESRAWSVLDEDIRRYYQTTRGFAQIKEEIKRILKKGIH